MSNQTLFDIYGDRGLPFGLITVNVVRVVISTIGVLLNAAFVFVTIKIKTLNSPCHLLLAFDCFVSAWYQLSSWFSLTVLFNNGNQFVNIRSCCLKILPPFQIGYTSSFNAIFLISVDRLISVLFPIWYSQRQISKKFYLIPMLFSSLLSPAIIIYAQFQIVYSVQETRQIICVASECSWSWAADLTYFLFTSFYGFTLINYSTVWIVLKYRTWKANNNLVSSYVWTQRILKTLFVIMLFNFVGLFMNSIARMVVPRFNLDITDKTLIIYSLSCLTSFVMSSNAPILFFFNQEYRKAFLVAFKIKTSIIKATNVVTAVNPNNQKLVANNFSTTNLRPNRIK